MSEKRPDQEEAIRALAEAATRRAQVRSADSALVWLQVLILAAYVFGAAIVSVSPDRSSAFLGIAVIAGVMAAIALVVGVGLRIRVLSRRGVIVFFATLVAFNLWNSAVVSASILTRFWALGQPSYHFGISEAVGVIPLLIGMWVLRRRPA